MKADFTEVFNFIFDCLKTVYNFLNSFEISFNSFSFSMWDFFLALLIISSIVPLISAFSYPYGASDFISFLFKCNSERIQAKEESRMAIAASSSVSQKFRFIGMPKSSSSERNSPKVFEFNSISPISFGNSHGEHDYSKRYSFFD